MLIKIIKGNYGYNDGVSVKVKTPADPPFHVSEDEALRLEGLGVAEIVESKRSKQDKEPDIPPYDSGDDGEPEENSENEGEDDFADLDDEDDSEDPGEDLSDDDSEDDTPEYSEENTKAELQAIASEWGIEIPGNASKAQILEILDDYFGNAPELSAKEPE